MYIKSKQKLMIVKIVSRICIVYINRYTNFYLCHIFLGRSASNTEKKSFMLHLILMNYSQWLFQHACSMADNDLIFRAKPIRWYMSLSSFLNVLSRNSAYIYTHMCVNISILRTKWVYITRLGHQMKTAHYLWCHIYAIELN